jgi:hypothetical protein
MSSTTANPPFTGSVAANNAKDPGKIALIVGVIGVAIALIGMGIGLSEGNNRPFVSWLIGFAFWFSMSIGMLYLVMMFYLFDAGWAIVVRRQLEHALAAIPVLAACFIPLLLLALGVLGHPGLVWQWLDPTHNPLIGKAGQTVSDDTLFVHKSMYLSLGGFLVRLAFYLAVFWGLSHLLRKNSFAMDRDPDAKYVLRCRKISAAGVFLVSFATTFAAFDFFMSISYQWFSTMYGVCFFATSMRCGLCGTVIMCYLLSEKKDSPLHGIYRRPHEYLLGCLCLTFTIFWAYVTFSQYFLIYNADVPEETFWFNIREMTANWTHNSWWYVSLALIFGYFFLPFFALLSYYNKVRRRSLVVICCWILCFHILDMYFNILPARVALAAGDPPNTLGYKIVEFIPNIWDLASLVGIGGLCVWACLRSRARANVEIIPIHDPRIAESLNYHE